MDVKGLLQTSSGAFSSCIHQSDEPCHHLLDLGSPAPAVLLSVTSSLDGDFNPFFPPFIFFSSLCSGQFRSVSRYKVLWGHMEGAEGVWGDLFGIVICSNINLLYV